MKYDIFISYRREDSSGRSNVPTARQFKLAFEAPPYNYKVFFDYSECTDNYFSDTILPAIRTCDFFVLVLTKDCLLRCSNEGDWVRREIEEAIAYNRKIIPITPDKECESIPLGLPASLRKLDGLQITTIYTDHMFEACVEFLVKNRFHIDSEAERKAKEEAERTRLEKERIAKAEAERKERETAERERDERKRKAEEARRKAEQERIERERREAEQEAKDASEKKRLSAICESKMEVPEGAVNGIFSVSPTKKVYFSKGNLLYQPSTRIWRFADRQYDLPGQYKSIGPGWMYLFRWMSGDDPEKIPSQFIDWGNNRIVNGGNCEGIWETLTHNEWKYVFEERETLTGLRFAKAFVEGVKGVVLFPDDWEADRIKIKKMNKRNAFFGWNSINAKEWARLEKDGAVFLPAAGFREMQEFKLVGDFGHYWTASYVENKAYAAYVIFYGGDLDIAVGNRYNGMSVRLVCPIK